MLYIMSPNTWGPPLWNFLHSFSINISDEGYDKIGKQFFNILFSICKALPCPECASHASAFIQKVNPNTLKTKIDMVNMLYLFHNAVNKRKMKPMFHYTLLRNYERVSVIDSYNHFVSTFMTNSSRLMNENLHRKMLVSQIKKWVISNIRYFIKPTINKVESYSESVIIEEDNNEKIESNTLQISDEIPEHENSEDSEIEHLETESQENINEENIQMNILEIKNINNNVLEPQIEQLDNINEKDKIQEIPIESKNKKSKTTKKKK